MTPEQIVASVLTVVAAIIATGLTYVALQMRNWIPVKGVVVETPLSGGEDGGFVRKVRSSAGALGERTCQPLDVGRSAAAEVGENVDLLHHPRHHKMVVFADFPAWKAAVIAWAVTIFILWTILR